MRRAGRRSELGSKSKFNEVDKHPEPFERACAGETFRRRPISAFSTFCWGSDEWVLWGVKSTARSQWNGGFGTHSGPSRGDPVGALTALSGHSSEPQRNVAKDGSRSVEAVTRDGAAPGRSWSGATSMRPWRVRWCPAHSGNSDRLRGRVVLRGRGLALGPPKTASPPGADRPTVRISRSSPPRRRRPRRTCRSAGWKTA